MREKYCCTWCFRRIICIFEMARITRYRAPAIIRKSTNSPFDVTRIKVFNVEAMLGRSKSFVPNHCVFRGEHRQASNRPAKESWFNSYCSTTRNDRFYVSYNFNDQFPISISKSPKSTSRSILPKSLLHILLINLQRLIRSKTVQKW